MKYRKTFVGCFVVVLMLVAAPVEAPAGDKSFSSIVKHIKRHYHARGQGTFGAITFGRFLVKIVRPAGVKDFKIALLRDLDYSNAPNPNTPDFNVFVSSAIDDKWRPVARYLSRQKREWTYVYARDSQSDMQILVVTLQRREAYVVQVRFSPEKLSAFIENPRILGVPVSGN